MKDTGEQAFPNEGFNGWGQPEKGMTLRDYFAAKAMQGMFAGRHGSALTPSEWATQAYELADAMLAERNKP
jgi:hypothetical protein